MSSLGVLADHHWYICVPPSHHQTNKGILFVCLSWHPFLPRFGFFLSLSLYSSWHAPSGSNSACFFWVVCHPSRTLPSKETFPLSPPPNHALLPLTYGLTMSCIGWVQAGGAWALRVLCLTRASLPYVSEICLLLIRLPWSGGLPA